MKERAVEQSFVFTSAIDALRAATVARLKPNRVREATFTGPEPDGRTPFLDAFEYMPDAPYAVCLAEAIVRSWLESPIVIDRTDLLAGVPRPKRVLFEHFSWGIQYHEDMLDDPAYAPRKAELRSRIEQQGARLFPLTEAHIRSEGIRRFGSEEAYDSLGGALWWVGGYQGHTVPDYPALLKGGIRGALNKIAEHAPRHPESAALYRAMEVLLLGFSEWILRYAAAAGALAESDPPRADQYLAIERNCRAIAMDPPKTLYQAAQLMWFYALWDWVDCIGRVDQYLYPFFLKTPVEEKWDHKEVIAALWLKGLEHGIHNVTLSGVLSDGSDATNELTYLMLDISRALHETHPRVSVRVHEGTPERLMQTVVDMWSEGMSDPTLASDPTVLAGMERLGVPIQHARDYSLLGCQEIEIPGKSNWGCEDGLMNLAKVFEYAANDGRCRRTGLQIGPRTGQLADFASVEALWDAYIAQMKFLTRHFVSLCNRGVEIRDKNIAKLVKMPFTEACIERGLNPDAGGALYNPGVVETAGSSAVADAFAAIETVIFTQRRFSMETLDRALGADFEGYERERLMLVHAPKFGNDQELADRYAKRVLDAFWDELFTYRSIRGGPFVGACSLLEGGITYGANTWAMPDGRRAGEPLGNSIGPRTGADQTGLTAMLKSVAALPLKKGVGGTTLNVLMPMYLMKTEALRRSIAGVMRTYLLSGGQMIQVTTANLQELLDAKAHPERHGNLIVRIGGFSIRFVELGREAQDEVIRRYG